MRASFVSMEKVCGVLTSYYMEEIGSYIWPKLKIRISSIYTCIKNLLFLQN
jgi:hypothetical protein